MSLALYRKYRPQTFAEIAGQNHIKQSLQNSLTKGSFSHAYLFTGPRGTGKTTMARVLAKALNCPKLKDKEPCNQCLNCQTISQGQALDIIEIDAASHTGVDNVREVIIEGTRFTPANLTYKVFIIDEVHMLSKGAFNALLKTLEEPPAHAIFILATTEIDKVPDTIISRCQRFDFHRLTIEQISQRLAQIVRREKAKAGKKALNLIAQNAQGGMRDAESLLGQILTLGQPLTPDLITDFLGLADQQKISQFFTLLLAKDKKQSLAFINQLNEQGLDFRKFIDQALEYWRQLITLKTDKGLKELAAPQLTNEEADVMVKQGQGASEKELLALFYLLLQSKEQAGLSPIAQLPLEIVVMEFCG